MRSDISEILERLVNEVDPLVECPYCQGLFDGFHYQIDIEAYASEIEGTLNGEKEGRE